MEHCESRTPTSSTAIAMVDEAMASADPATHLLLLPARVRLHTTTPTATPDGTIRAVWEKVRTAFIAGCEDVHLDPVSRIHAVPRVHRVLRNAGLEGDVRDVEAFALRLAEQYSTHFVQMTLIPTAPGEALWETGVVPTAEGGDAVFTPTPAAAASRMRAADHVARQAEFLTTVSGFLAVHRTELAARTAFARHAESVLPELLSGAGELAAPHDRVADSWISYFAALFGDRSDDAHRLHGAITERLEALPGSNNDLSLEPRARRREVEALAAEAVGLNCAAERLLPALVRETSGPTGGRSVELPQLAAELVGRTICDVRAKNPMVAAMAEQMPRRTPIRDLTLLCSTIAGPQLLRLDPGSAAEAHRTFGYDLVAAERLTTIAQLLPDATVGEITREMLLAEGCAIIEGGARSDLLDRTVARVTGVLKGHREWDTVVSATTDMALALDVTEGPVRDTVAAAVCGGYRVRAAQGMSPSAENTATTTDQTRRVPLACGIRAHAAGTTADRRRTAVKADLSADVHRHGHVPGATAGPGPQAGLQP